MAVDEAELPRKNRSPVVAQNNRPGAAIAEHTLIWPMSWTGPCPPGCYASVGSGMPRPRCRILAFVPGRCVTRVIRWGASQASQMATSGHRRGFPRVADDPPVQAMPVFMLFILRQLRVPLLLHSTIQA